MAEWKYYNPNPKSKRVGDCVVRAISAATGQDWDTTYTGLALQAFVLKDMPSSNHVWDEYIRSRGFEREAIPNTCPDCYTVADFADDHPHGVYVLGTGNHAICIRDGCVYDSFDSTSEVPILYYYKED